MPHSSGGGSHGGGGFHSSYSGGGSGSSASSYGEPPIRRSREPFAHCHTYVYYRNYMPYYLYTDRPLKGGFCTKKTVRISVIIAVIVLCLGGFVTRSAYNRAPSKLDTESESAVIDNAGILNNTSEIETELQKFKEDTGIAVGFETVNNENWKVYYDDLESYAYEQYLLTFDGDESCWLIIYSEPLNPDPSFNDWSWEGMQGDDTDNLLNYASTSVFGENFQNSLLKGKSIEDALCESLTLTEEKMMSPRTDEDIQFLGFFILSIGFVILVGIALPTYIIIRSRGYADNELNEISEKDLMVTCPYCKRQFFNTGFKKCPFCHEEL